MAKASDNEFPSVLFAEQSSDPATPSAGTARLFVNNAATPELELIDDSGTVTTFGSGGGGTTIVTDSQERTAGNVTVSSTSYAAVDTGTDLTVAASSGDVLQVGLSALYENQAIFLNVTAASMVSGSPVNYIVGSSSTNGVSSWYGVSGQYTVSGGSVLYTVQAGDISGGNVTLRLFARISGASPSKVIRANSNDPLNFWVVNLG